jgi:hypothetical protein
VRGLLVIIGEHRRRRWLLRHRGWPRVALRWTPESACQVIRATCSFRDRSHRAPPQHRPPSNAVGSTRCLSGPRSPQPVTARTETRIVAKGDQGGLPACPRSRAESRDTCLGRRFKASGDSPSAMVGADPIRVTARTDRRALDQVSPPRFAVSYPEPRSPRAVAPRSVPRSARRIHDRNSPRGRPRRGRHGRTRRCSLADARELSIQTVVTGRSDWAWGRDASVDRARCASNVGADRGIGACLAHAAAAAPRAAAGGGGRAAGRAAHAPDLVGHPSRFALLALVLALGVSAFWMFVARRVSRRCGRSSRRSWASISCW